MNFMYNEWTQVKLINRRWACTTSLKTMNWLFWGYLVFKTYYCISDWASENWWLSQNMPNHKYWIFWFCVQYVTCKMLLIKLCINDDLFKMAWTDKLLWCSKVEKCGEIIWAHLVHFCWPCHIIYCIILIASTHANHCSLTPDILLSMPFSLPYLQAVLYSAKFWWGNYDRY